MSRFWKRTIPSRHPTHQRHIVLGQYLSWDIMSRDKMSPDRDWYQSRCDEKSWTSILWSFDTWGVQRKKSVPQSPASSTIGAREAFTRGILGCHSRPWWMKPINLVADQNWEVIENWDGVTSLSVLFCLANPQPPGGGRQEKSSGQHEVSSQQTPFNTSLNTPLFWSWYIQDTDI